MGAHRERERERRSCKDQGRQGSVHHASLTTTSTCQKETHDSSYRHQLCSAAKRDCAVSHPVSVSVAESPLADVSAAHLSPKAFGLLRAPAPHAGCCRRARCVVRCTRASRGSARQSAAAPLIDLHVVRRATLSRRCMLTQTRVEKRTDLARAPARMQWEKRA